MRTDVGVQLILPHFTNYRMVGRDLDSLRLECRPVSGSDYEADPSRFNDREWIGATYRVDDEIYALVHNEYQGHTHSGRCPSGVYRRCWYNAITLALSSDGGRSYEHSAPPSHVVASLPVPYTPDGGTMGLFSPSNIVRNASDEYFYAMVFVTGAEDRPRGTCLMRTRDVGQPSSWRAWDGDDFTVAFANPYERDLDDPSEHFCSPVSRNEISEMRESLTYNTYLKKFLLVGLSGAPDRETGRNVWGIYYSVSENLIDWSPRTLLMKAETVNTFRCGDADPIAYPSVIDPDSRSPNFETSDRRAYLYFTQFHYSSCKQGPDRDLRRVPVEFSK